MTREKERERERALEKDHAFDSFPKHETTTIFIFKTRAFI